MDLVEKIKTITYTACAAILTIVASICIFKLSNRACKVMDNFNGAIEGQLDKNGVPQDGLAGLVKKGNKVADGFKVVLNGESDEQGALHGGLKDTVKNLNVVIEGQPDEQDVPRGGLKDMVKNLNDAIEGRFDENGQPYGFLPMLKYVTGMVDGSEPAPGTISGNIAIMTECGAKFMVNASAASDELPEMAQNANETIVNGRNIAKRANEKGLYQVLKQPKEVRGG